MAQRKKWSELSTGARVAVVVGGAIELVLLVVAGRDLRSRSAEEVRGPRWLWGLFLPVQPVGPIAYLLVGRRRR
jgi:hypothetical protein